MAKGSPNKRASSTAGRRAETRKARGSIVHALWTNLALLAAALLLPRGLATSEDAFAAAAGAAMLFAVPMTAVLIVGVWVLVRQFFVARREGRSMPAFAFLPLGVFFLGVGAVALLIAWSGSSIGAP